MKYKEYKTENAIKTEGKKIYLRIEDDGSQSISCNEDNEDFKAWGSRREHTRACRLDSL